MAIYKRGEVYWFSFVWNGQRVQESTHQSNRLEARNMEATHKAGLVDEYKERKKIALERNCKPEDLRHCADCGNLFNAANPITSTDGKYVFCSELCDQKWRSRQSPTPTFSQFAERFLEKMRSDHASKPATLEYYENNVKTLLKFEAFENARLNEIDRELIDSYIQKRRGQKAKGKKKPVKISTVNRSLEVLRRMTRLAAEWGILNRAPKISRLPGEAQRDRILDHAEEQTYLAVTKQPLRDIATLILDGGFRPEEVFRMRWENVNFQPAGKALYGYIHNPFGKTKYARRNISMTARVKALLDMRHDEQGKPSEGWVFPAETKTKHTDSVKSPHARALRDSGVRPFVLYSLRHTMLTRLGEAGADAFSIQKIAGHSSIEISTRYVHPTPERIEGAFTALEQYNTQKEEELKAEQERVRVQ